MEPFLKKLDFELSDSEKHFFVNEDDQVLIYPGDAQHPQQIMFPNDDVRHGCLSKFLAYHSDSFPTAEQYLFLNFSNDLEIFQAMIQPKEYQKAMEWKTEVTPEIVEIFAQTKIGSDLIPVVLTVGDSDRTMHHSHFKINLPELFAEELLPWTIRQKDVTVFLSRFQYKMFLDGEKPKVIFYEADKSLEPLITDSELKDSLFNKITTMIYQFLLEKGEDLTNKAIKLQFKNGDRDLLSALIGTIKYQYYEVVDKDTLQGEQLYETIKNSVTSVVIYVYFPGTEKILYTGQNIIKT